MSAEYILFVKLYDKPWRDLKTMSRIIDENHAIEIAKRIRSNTNVEAIKVMKQVTTFEPVVEL